MESNGWLQVSVGTERQQDLWVATGILPVSILNVFYDGLNRVLWDGNFDHFGES